MAVVEGPEVIGMEDNGCEKETQTCCETNRRPVPTLTLGPRFVPGCLNIPRDALGKGPGLHEGSSRLLLVEHIYDLSGLGKRHTSAKAGNVVDTTSTAYGAQLNDPQNEFL